MTRSKVTGGLLADFIRFGCLTFGGGWSIVAQMQEKYVNKEQSITAEELLDLVSVAKSLPGTMVGNVAMLYGYRVGGLAGGFAAVLGMCLPPMGILILISLFYEAFRNNFWISALMEGMQAAVVPIIASAALGLAKGSVQFPPCVAVAAACFGLYLFTGVHVFVLVLIGVVAGLFIGDYYEKRGQKV